MTVSDCLVSNALIHSESCMDKSELKASGLLISGVAFA
jgi:hypothetical protein